MKKEIKKYFGIILIMVLMLPLFATGVFAQNQTGFAQTTQQVSQGVQSAAYVEQAFKGAGNVLTKVFGLNPLVHGVIAGAFSAVNTFSKLSQVEIDFLFSRDKVNISEDEKDYFTPYDSHLLDNRLDQKVANNYMLITDKNILDTRFINVKTLSEIDSSQNRGREGNFTRTGTNSPAFRLAEKIKLVKVFDSNNQPVDIQKREILFEDPDKTIEHEYEYRFFVMRYPKSTYQGRASYELKFEEITSFLSFLTKPFSTGTSLISLNKILDETNTRLLEVINKNKKEDMVTEPFRLVFNSYIRDDISDSLELDQVNCVTEGGMLLGQTGSEALPKIALNWDFKHAQDVDTISGVKVNTLDWCDADLTGEDNKHSIFCDATQFTIEILNKLKKINDFVEANRAGFTCPTPGVSQALISENNNLGITLLDSSYDTGSIFVNFKVEGSFNLDQNQTPPPSYGILNLTVYKDNIKIHDRNVSLDVINFVDNKFIEEEIFNVGIINDDETRLRVVGAISLVEPYKSLEVSTQDNILENIFTPNSEICNLEKTASNLNLYSKNAKIDSSLIEFRSYLMKDGYSDDFKQDFDRHYRFSVIGTPTFYTDSFYKFMSTDRLSFKSSFDSEPGRLILQGPGIYNVLLDVEFDDQWRLFDSQGNVTGKVEVVLSREIGPERDSPVYYMPFNGVVGIDSDNARQGYGVDFTGDIVTITQLTGTGQYLRTEPFTQSNTINTVSVKEYGKQPTEFSFLNNGQTRGMLLSISLSGNKTNPELYFVPSRATPVALKVSNQANDAYSFYKLDVGGPQAQGGEPALTPGSLVPWTGVGECLDFTGISVLESFLYRPDIHAISSKLAPITPSQSVAYGVEWEARNITRRGNVFLRTVLYTPSNFKNGPGISVLYQDSFDDDALFYTKDTLNGSKTVELKNVFGSDIKFVSEVFSLVKDKKACIDYSGNNLTVYYNPVAVSQELFDGSLETDAQNSWVNQRGACIVN
jgi:hypothetical protein